MQAAGRDPAEIRADVAAIGQARAVAEQQPADHRRRQRTARDVQVRRDRGVLELVREEKLLDEATLADILLPENMIAPRLIPLRA